MPCGDSKLEKGKPSFRNHKIIIRFTSIFLRVRLLHKESAEHFQRFFILNNCILQKLFSGSNRSLLDSLFEFFTLENSLNHNTRNMNLIRI